MVLDDLVWADLASAASLWSVSSRSVSPAGSARTVDEVRGGVAQGVGGFLHELGDDVRSRFDVVDPSDGGAAVESHRVDVAGRVGGGRDHGEPWDRYGDRAELLGAHLCSLEAMNGIDGRGQDALLEVPTDPERRRQRCTGGARLDQARLPKRVGEALRSSREARPDPRTVRPSGENHGQRSTAADAARSQHGHPYGIAHRRDQRLQWGITDDVSSSLLALANDQVGAIPLGGDGVVDRSHLTGQERSSTVNRIGEVSLRYGEADFNQRRLAGRNQTASRSMNGPMKFTPHGPTMARAHASTSPAIRAGLTYVPPSMLSAPAPEIATASSSVANSPIPACWIGTSAPTRSQNRV